MSYDHSRAGGAWVRVSERLPTRGDADFDGFLYTYGEDGRGSMDVRETFWEDAVPPYITHFMPKPFIAPPLPPTADKQGDSA